MSNTPTPVPTTAPRATAPTYYGKDCPVGMVQVEFVGCSPKDRIGEYGWKPCENTFIEVYVDGQRYSISVGAFHDGQAERRGLHIVCDRTMRCAQTSVNAASLFIVPTPEVRDV